MAEKILVFVPCYNCAPQIGRVIRQLAAAPEGREFEVLIVDNGSTDGTVEAAVEALPLLGATPASVVRNRDNYNLGGSHKAAFAYAERQGHSHVLILHGDDQGALADAEPILGAGLHLSHDACLGARFMPGSRLQGYSAFRVFGNHVFNAIFSLVAGRRLYDLGSGLNLVGREVFTDPDVLRYSDDLRFNNYLLLGLVDKRRRLMFFPISWREDDQVSNVKMASQAIRTLAIALQYLFRRDEFRGADHRAQPRAAYDFDVVARHSRAEGLSAAGG